MPVVRGDRMSMPEANGTNSPRENSDLSARRSNDSDDNTGDDKGRKGFPNVSRMANQGMNSKKNKRVLTKGPTTNYLSNNGGAYLVDVQQGYHHPPISAQKFGTLIPNRLFVGGISENTTEEDLNRLFSSFGSVVATKIIVDRCGVSKGYGFVTFETEMEAKRLFDALESHELDPLTLNDRRINVAPAVKKQVPNSGDFDVYNHPGHPTQTLPHSNGFPAFSLATGTSFFLAQTPHPGMAQIYACMTPQGAGPCGEPCVGSPTIFSAVPTSPFVSPCHMGQDIAFISSPEQLPIAPTAAFFSTANCNGYFGPDSGGVMNSLCSAAQTIGGGDGGGGPPDLMLPLGASASYFNHVTSAPNHNNSGSQYNNGSANNSASGSGFSPNNWSGGEFSNQPTNSSSNMCYYGEFSNNNSTPHQSSGQNNSTNYVMF